jgi:hypothetical protein
MSPKLDRRLSLNPAPKTVRAVIKGSIVAFTSKTSVAVELYLVEPVLAFGKVSEATG